MKLTTFTLIILLPFELMAQFGQETRVTNAAGESFTSYNNANCIVANGDVVHLVYTDERGLKGEVYYQRSIDGGKTWQTAVPLTTNDGSFSGYPSIAVLKNDVHVVWADRRSGRDNIYYRKSSNGGNSWSAETKISAGMLVKLSSSRALMNGLKSYCPGDGSKRVQYISGCVASALK